jgi:hypothetical protein
VHTRIGKVKAQSSRTGQRESRAPFELLLSSSCQPGSRMAAAAPGLVGSIVDVQRSNGAW